ncbi:pyridoxamine 5'-phosphate oxidase, partial [Vibrio cholerae]
MDLSDIRRVYIHGGLRRKDLQATRLVQFHLWLEQAIDANVSV